MTSAVNFLIYEPGASPAVSLAVSYGAAGGVLNPASRVAYDASTKTYSGKASFPPGANAFEIKVYRAVEGVWVLRGALRVDMNGLPKKRGDACKTAMVQIADTPDAARSLLAPPAALMWLSSASQPPAQARREYLDQFQRTAWREMKETLPYQIVYPPLLARSSSGVVPFWATFVTPVVADDAMLEALLELALHLDGDPGALDALPPAAQARVLARALTLLPTTVEYVPDVTIGGAAAPVQGATPDQPPRKPRGAMPTNTFDDATATWTGDCEDQTGLAVAVWRAMCASRAPRVRAFVERFRVMILVITVAGARPGAFHVCGALFPRAGGTAALLESVVRTCGIPQRGDTYHAPVGNEQLGERPLVLQPGGDTLNMWYKDVVFGVDADCPHVMQLPFVGDRGGASVAQLLLGQAELRPMGAAIPELLVQRILGERGETPATDLSQVRVLPGAERLDARRPMVHARQVADGDAAIHIPDVLRNPTGSWYIF